MFNDWLDLMLYSLQGQDEPYLEIVNTYDNDGERGEREIDYFAQAFHELREGMAETNTDLLGVIYEERGLTNDAFAQFFTPHNLCDATADMLIAVEDPDRYTENNPFTVADPTCGSGRMLIYAAKHLPEEIPSAVFYGQDKDSTCAKMTALNLCLFNLDGYAVLGDSLRMEARRLWATRGSPFGGSVHELDPDEVGNPFTAGTAEQDSKDSDQQEQDDSDQQDDTDVDVDTADVDVELRQSTFTEYSE